MRLVQIDGSMGEGGGQILRTAVALSSITGRPIRIRNIRAKRENPGLRPQHLTAVKAVATIAGGRLVGATIGSTTLEFYPGRITGGSYSFDVGTAGSVSLVLQSLLPLMAFAESPIEVKISGGTDVPMAPTIDYMSQVLLRLLVNLGYRFELKLERRGHYPRGGGLVIARSISAAPRCMDLGERGRLLAIGLRSHASGLPRHVAERQAAAAASLVKRELGVEARVEIEVREGEDVGSGIAIWAEFDKSFMGADALGAPGKRAEIVGEEAARGLIDDIKTGAPLDRHASDMIPIYLSLTKCEALIRGAELTSHASTVLELLKILIEGFDYEVRSKGSRPFEVIIRSPGIS